MLSSSKNVEKEEIKRTKGRKINRRKIKVRDL